MKPSIDSSFFFRPFFDEEGKLISVSAGKRLTVLNFLHCKMPHRMIKAMLVTSKASAIKKIGRNLFRK